MTNGGLQPSERGISYQYQRINLLDYLTVDLFCSRLSPSTQSTSKECDIFNSSFEQIVNGAETSDSVHTAHGQERKLLLHSSKACAVKYSTLSASSSKSFLVPFSAFSRTISRIEPIVTSLSADSVVQTESRISVDHQQFPRDSVHQHFCQHCVGMPSYRRRPSRKLQLLFAHSFPFSFLFRVRMRSTLRDIGAKLLSEHFPQCPSI